MIQIGYIIIFLAGATYQILFVTFVIIFIIIIISAVFIIIICTYSMSLTINQTAKSSPLLVYINMHYVFYVNIITITFTNYGHILISILMILDADDGGIFITDELTHSRICLSAFI